MIKFNQTYLVMLAPVDGDGGIVERRTVARDDEEAREHAQQQAVHLSKQSGRAYRVADVYRF